MINALINFTKDYIDLTLGEPVGLLKQSYKNTAKNPARNSVKYKKTKFSLKEYIIKQNQMTSPQTDYSFNDASDLRNRAEVKNEFKKEKYLIH